MGVEQRTFTVPLRVPSAVQALAMMQEAFGAYRAVVSDSSEAVRGAAWAGVAATLKTFETPAGFVAPAEVLVAAAVKPAHEAGSDRPTPDAVTPETIAARGGG